MSIFGNNEPLTWGDCAEDPIRMDYRFKAAIRLRKGFTRKEALENPFFQAVKACILQNENESKGLRELLVRVRYWLEGGTADFSPFNSGGFPLRDEMAKLPKKIKLQEELEFAFFCLSKKDYLSGSDHVAIARAITAIDATTDTVVPIGI